MKEVILGNVLVSIYMYSGIDLSLAVEIPFL